MQKRFKNKPATTEHEYSVVWNQDCTRFEIRRNGMKTPSFSSHQATAIGLALKNAQREAAKSDRKIIVTAMRNGMRVTKWDSLTQP